MARKPVTLNTDELLAHAEAVARQELLEQQRERLQQMVYLRLDPKVLSRIDPAKLVDEALAEAATQWDDYFSRPQPFYAWLRKFAWKRVVQHYKRHAKPQDEVTNEEPWLPLTEKSARLMIDRMASQPNCLTGLLETPQQRAQVRAALDRLPIRDREVLILRFLEKLAHRDIAGTLGRSELVVKSRYLHALQKLRDILTNKPDEILP